MRHAICHAVYVFLQRVSARLQHHPANVRARDAAGSVSARERCRTCRGRAWLLLAEESENVENMDGLAQHTPCLCRLACLCDAAETACPPRKTQCIVSSSWGSPSWASSWSFSCCSTSPKCAVMLVSRSALCNGPPAVQIALHACLSKMFCSQEACSACCVKQA